VIALKWQAVKDENMLADYNPPLNDNLRHLENPNLYQPKKLDLYKGPYTPVEKLNRVIVDPAAIKVGVETRVKFSVAPNNYLPRVAYIELEQFDLKTNDYTSLGKLSDDGRKGDFDATDGIYALEVPIKSDKLGYLQFRFKAEGTKGYFYSDPFKIEVSPANIPNNYPGGSSTKIINDPELGKVVANEVLVIVKEDTPATRVEQIVKEINGTISGRMAELNIWTVQLPPSNDASNIKEAIEKLKSYPEIELAAPDGVSTLQ
jgi:hypothetical protein